MKRRGCLLLLVHYINVCVRTKRSDSIPDYNRDTTHRYWATAATAQPTASQYWCRWEGYTLVETQGMIRASAGRGAGGCRHAS